VGEPLRVLRYVVSQRAFSYISDKIKLSLANCYIYDIEVKQWYIQPIQGTPPLPLRDACAVVSYASDNSSANIYVYGGKANTGNSFTPQGEMWVLSLPAFIVSYKYEIQW